MCYKLRYKMVKKILLLIWINLIVGGCLAQQTWHCQGYDEAMRKFEDVEKKFKSKGNKTWARELLQVFPIAADKTIKHQFVIKSDSTFDVKTISQLLLAWCKIKFPEATPDSVTSHEHLRVSGILKGVGQTMGAYGTYINAREEVMIDVKGDRVRVTSRIFNYMVGTWKGAEHTLPGDGFPVIPDASQKDSHAMAFINSNYNCLLTVSNLIKYLNDNVKTINNDDDW